MPLWLEINRVPKYKNKNHTQQIFSTPKVDPDQSTHMWFIQKFLYIHSSLTHTHYLHTQKSFYTHFPFTYIHIEKPFSFLYIRRHFFPEPFASMSLVFSTCLSLSLPSLLGIFSFFCFFFSIVFSCLVYKSVLFIPKFDSKIPYSSLSLSLLPQNDISLYIPSPSHYSSRSSS